jgi:hypothetical protein
VTRPGRKAEAAFAPRSGEDGTHKVEGETSTGAKIGTVIGAGIGAVAGGLSGGTLGSTLLGGAIGGLVGAGVGALIGHFVGRGGIDWDSANYAADSSAGASTTVERPFKVGYKAIADGAKNVWRLVVDSIQGAVDIHVHTGGSRDPFALPPTTQPEASSAVTDMKGYYARGYRGAWHTEAASKAHEGHHYREWKCASEHYWPAAKASIESLTAPLPAHPNEASAIAALRAGASGADSKIKTFHDAAYAYWFTLSDSAGGRPYAAGQLVLNQAVRHVQDLAKGKGWVVPGGTSDPNPEPPCYLPYP